MPELRQEFFGIDFGTTNTAVIGRYRKNITKYGDYDDQPFPSLIAVSKVTGEVQAIGRKAWQDRQELSESCEILTSTKMKLGSTEQKRIGPELWSPERAACEIFKELKKRVNDRGNGAFLDDPVIAIPVGFSPERRKDLRKAAKNAGLSIKGFVTEPTAAVFSNFDRINKWSKIVVFDWGGGTLDISVVGIDGKTVEEIATKSLNLGGDDLDRIIADWAHNQILKDKKKDGPAFSAMEAQYRDRMLSQCEKAKRMLSEGEIWEISIARYGDFGTINVILIEDDFKSLMAPKIEETLSALKDCVQHRAKLSFDQIGCILMVGGSSQLHGLREAIDSHNWSCDVLSPPDSDWNVAEGASLLASKFGDYVCAQNVGVQLCDNTIFALIKSGDIIDREEKITTFGLIDNDNNARFVFVESKLDSSSFDSQIRILDYLTVLTKGFSNEPIEVVTSVDENLLFKVTAKSQIRAEKYGATWEYPELRFKYMLPG